jgi:hypothetical protein
MLTIISSRDNKWQPRLRQLELGGVNRGRPHALRFDVAGGCALAITSAKTGAKAGAKTGCNALQRVSRGDLCAAAPVGESGTSLSDETLGQWPLKDWPLGD